MLQSTTTQDAADAFTLNHIHFTQKSQLKLIKDCYYKSWKRLRTKFKTLKLQKCIDAENASLDNGFLVSIDCSHCSKIQRRFCSKNYPKQSLGQTKKCHLSVEQKTKIFDNAFHLSNQTKDVAP